MTGPTRHSFLELWQCTIVQKIRSEKRREDRENARKRISSWEFPQLLEIPIIRTRAKKRDDTEFEAIHSMIYNHLWNEKWWKEETQTPAYSRSYSTDSWERLRYWSRSYRSSSSSRTLQASIQGIKRLRNATSLRNSRYENREGRATSKRCRDTLLWENSLGRSRLCPSTIVEIKTTVVLEEFSVGEDLHSSILHRDWGYLAGFYEERNAATTTSERGKGEHHDYLNDVGEGEDESDDTGPPSKNKVLKVSTDKT